MSHQKESPLRIVIAGGGFGGLEVAFYLRQRLGKIPHITLVSPQPYFLFKPNTIYIPFGKDPELYKISFLEGARRHHIEFVQTSAIGVDPEKRILLTESGEIPYDYLVLATGAAMNPQEIPGLSDYANTIWTPEEMLRLRESLSQAIEKARQGKSTRLVFLVPPNNKCSGPLYELVLMSDTYLRRLGVRDHFSIRFVTYERSFIQAFGPRLDEVVEKEFRERNIAGDKGKRVKAVEAGEIHIEGGEKVPYDLLVAFPPYVAQVRYAGLPQDERGFLHTDLATRQVVGFPQIYAVGDAGDFPVKQAFLALLQADTAAEHIAQQVLGEVPTAAFDPTSMCIMEELDKATFAKVPLELTGDPSAPVRVREKDQEEYKVGVGKIWRVGKKLLGTTLPARFRAGKPFHAGASWEMMEAGLKIMASLFAD